MADHTETNPDAEARKWFTIAIVGAFLYVSTVFAFIITRDVESDTASSDTAPALRVGAASDTAPALRVGASQGTQQEGLQPQEAPRHGQSD